MNIKIEKLCVFCEIRRELINEYLHDWLRLSPAGLSCRWVEFHPVLVHVRFVVLKVTLGQIFLPLLWFSPIRIIPPLLHIYFDPNTNLVRRTGGQIVGVFEARRALDILELFTSCPCI